MDTKGPHVKRLALLAAIAAPPSPGCGEKKETTTTAGSEPLTVMLDFFPNADHAGLYAAQARGDFKRAGLHVKLQPPNDPSEPLRLLAAGRVDLAISYEPELFLARDKGLKLAPSARSCSAPLTSIISLKASPSPATFRASGSARRDPVPDGVPQDDPEQRRRHRRQGGQRRVQPGPGDAVQEGRRDARRILELRGHPARARKHKHPKIIRVDEAGVPTYDELVVVAREDTLRTRDGAAKVRRFMQATAAGYNAVRADPNAGVDPLVAAAGPRPRACSSRRSKATLPAFFPPGASPSAGRT